MPALALAALIAIHAALPSDRLEDSARAGQIRKEAADDAQDAPGWGRDERGRLMQLTFDLNRRIYLGAAYAPLRFRGGEDLRTRYRGELGIDFEFPDFEYTRLLRFHLFEGEIFLGPLSSGTFTAFRFDWSRWRARPVARITTFVGEPSRFDLDLNLTGYFEALRLESVLREGVTHRELLLATAQPLFDAWHSRDLASYARVRAGPGLTLDTVRETFHLLVEAAVEADFPLDRGGFHYLRFLAQGEKLFFAPGAGDRRTDPRRLRLRAEYEVIFLALNDHPLSLALDVRGTWREDLAFVQPGWELSAGAGLRLSLWVPTRRRPPPERL